MTSPSLSGIVHEQTSPIANSTLFVLEEERDKQIREIAKLRSELEEVKVRTQFKVFEDSVNDCGVKRDLPKVLKKADPIEDLMSKYNIKKTENGKSKEMEMERFIENFMKKQKTNTKPSHVSNKSVSDTYQSKLRSEEVNENMKVELNKLTCLLDKSKEKNKILEEELRKVKIEMTEKEQLFKEKIKTLEEQLKDKEEKKRDKGKEVDLNELWIEKMLDEVIGVGEPFLSTEAMTLKEKLEYIKSLMVRDKKKDWDKKSLESTKKIARLFTGNTKRSVNTSKSSLKKVEEKTLKPKIVNNENKPPKDMSITDIRELTTKVTALEERMHELECKTERLKGIILDNV